MIHPLSLVGWSVLIEQIQLLFKTFKNINPKYRFRQTDITTMKLSNPFKSNHSGTILVTGGDGVVSHRVAVKLLESGYPSVRLGLVEPQKATNVPKGAAVVEFDWDREETYAAALKDVTSVFISIPHHDTWQHNFALFLELARSAGVKHFVSYPIHVCNEYVMTRYVQHASHGLSHKISLLSGI